MSEVSDKVLETLFDFRQIFSFLIPGFLFLVFLYLLCVSFYYNQSQSLIVLWHLSWLKEYKILLTVLIILLSFFLGLIVDKVSKFILDTLMGTKLSSMSSKLVPTGRLDKIVDKSYDVEKIAIRCGFTGKESEGNYINELFYFCKDYTLHNSEPLGKRLRSVEYEIALYSSSFFVLILIFFLLLFLSFQYHILFLFSILCFLLILICQQGVVFGRLNEYESAFRFFLTITNDTNSTSE